MVEEGVDVKTHTLVPKHTKLSVEEADKLLEKYNVSRKQLPKIVKSDPAIKELEPEVGEIVEISRNSPTIGPTKYYRVIING